MIAIDVVPESGAWRCVVRPNRSMTWEGIVAFYGVTVAVGATIALGMVLLGAWPVVPFTGLELAALGAALYVTAWRGERREVIAIGADTVVIEKGHRVPTERHEFQRAWAHVVVARPRNSGPERVFVRSHGRQVELGSDLAEDERERLAQAISDALAGRVDPGMTAAVGA